VIHLFKNNGYNLCLDVNSGSVHVLDNLSYDVLSLMSEGREKDDIISSLSDKYDPAEISETISECDALKAEGSLFSEDPYKPAIEKFTERPTVVKALCLQIAHDCNLACRYCFADEGEYHGKRGMMSYEVGKKSL
jgi:uncharacterized protein